MTVKDSYRVALLVVLLAAIILFQSDIAALAQTGPLDAIAAKGDSARDQIILIGKSVIGVAAAVLFVLAAMGRAAWHWVIMVVIAGAGLQALPAIQGWLNS